VPYIILLMDCASVDINMEDGRYIKMAVEGGQLGSKFNRIISHPRTNLQLVVRACGELDREDIINSKFKLTYKPMSP
jgi:hypothetical protein